MAARPSWPQQGVIPDLNHLVGKTHSLTRFYASAVILRHLLKTINPTSEWATRIVEHVGTLHTSLYVNLESAGFPQNWTQLNIWK